MSNKPFLFGGSSSGGSGNKYLVEFKAGKMSLKDKTVSADKRKGVVYVHQTEDSLMHFCWKDRTSGVVEDDLIIFPEDVIFKKVPECTSGRVFVLKFKSSSRRCFYWLQESKTDKDTEYCTKVNQYLNSPPTGSSRGGAGGTSTPSISGIQAELNSIADGDLHNLLNNMSQQQLLQLLGGVGTMNVANLSSLLGSSRLPSTPSSSASDTPRTAPETPAVVTPPQPVTAPPAITPITVPTPSTPAPSSNPSIQLSDLQNILSGMNVPVTTDTEQSPSVDLSSAFTAEALLPLLNNKELMDRLREHLPPSELSTSESSSTPSEQVRSTIVSPQFQQALSLFSAALQSGQLGPLMQQFGMNNRIVEAANSGEMDAFIRAIQEDSQAAGSATEGTAKKKDEDKDEDMSLD